MDSPSFGILFGSPTINNAVNTPVESLANASQSSQITLAHSKDLISGALFGTVIGGFAAIIVLAFAFFVIGKRATETNDLVKHKQYQCQNQELEHRPMEL